jgi:hypothetical protein
MTSRSGLLNVSLEAGSVGLNVSASYLSLKFPERYVAFDGVTDLEEGLIDMMNRDQVSL